MPKAFDVEPRVNPTTANARVPGNRRHDTQGKPTAARVRWWRWSTLGAGLVLLAALLTA